MWNAGPLSVSLAGLDRGPGHPWSGGAREAIAWAAAARFGTVQLDASMSGVRPRELDRSGRRDLAAMLKRSGLTLSGLDLWIPPPHFVSDRDVDRAVDAVRGALDMTSELVGLVPGSQPVVALTLPAGVSPGVVSALGSAAGSVGAVLADHAWPVRTAAVAHVGVGIDPAAVILGGAKPGAAVLGLTSMPVAVRWSDLAATGRVEPGLGSLDCLEYSVALHTKGFSGAMVVDLRGLADQAAVVEAIRRRLSGDIV